MSTVDPTGKLVVTVRDDPGVAAITTRVRGGEKGENDAPPYVVVVPLAMSPGLPGLVGSRARLAAWRHALRCYGPKARGGDRQAEALGLAVSAALHEAGPVRFAAPGGGQGNAGIYQVLVEGMGGPLTDPDTQEPYVVVTTSLTASAQSF